MPKNNVLPLHGGILHRPRLHNLIQKGLQHPLLVILALPGYGKTQAMSDYLSNSDVRFLWLRLSVLDNFQNHFWSHFTRALEKEFPDLSEPMKTLGFPDTPFKFEVFLNMFSKSIRKEKEVVWVFDDFGEITDHKIIDFFKMTAKVEIDRFHLVLISNMLSGVESPVFLTENRFLISGEDLCFTRNEIFELYNMYTTPLETYEADLIEQYTEGWPLPLHLLALQHNKLSDFRHQSKKLTAQIISPMFENRFFSNYPKRDQKLLVKLSMLSSFTKDFALDLYDNNNITELHTLENHVFIMRDPTLGHFSFHHLYDLFLQNKMYILNEEEKRQVWKKAAEYYSSSGNLIEAITCYRKCGDHINMLRIISDYVKQQSRISPENAAFILEHLNLLADDEISDHPEADYLRALLYLHILELDRSEKILLDMEQDLLARGTAKDTALLGEVYSTIGAIHMMKTQEDFGDYYKKATICLPGGTNYQQWGKLNTYNNHNFSMLDNQPGAKERMERAVHYGAYWMSKFLHGSMSGIEHIFSAEKSYLSYELEDAQQYAYQTIYKAEHYAQHDLVCNSYCLLARIALMQGNLTELDKQIKTITDYAGRYEISVLKEIRDMALSWYYIKLHDHKRLTKILYPPDSLSDKPILTYGRSQIVYANFLIRTGEYAKLVGTLEYPKGLYLSKGIWPDRICLYIMLAIGYRHLGKHEKSVEALWKAYDMSYHNGLITLFIEAENQMCDLIDLVRQQHTYEFDSQWLDVIYNQASAFCDRLASARAVYKKQNPVKSIGNSPLTKRETDILQDLSRGLTREEISVEQYISINTVKTFIRNIYNKLDAANRAEAVSIAISRGYIDAPIPK